MRDHSTPVCGFLPSLMPAIRVLVGWSNDCQRTAPLLSSRTTRLPDSSSWATAAEGLSPSVVFEDHAARLDPSRR